MLIHFDTDPARLSNAPKGILTTAVPELLRAHRLGHHVVVINRPAAEWLRDNVALGELDRATLIQIGNEYTQTADLIRRALILVAVSVEEEREPRIARNAILMNLQDATRPYLLERTVLVVEDTAHDGRLYEVMLDWLRDKAQAPPVRCETIHGGGDRIETVVEDKLSDRRAVCVVVDTDRHAPMAGNLAKVERLRRLSIARNWPVIEIAVPRCREIENLISLDVVRTLPSAVQRQDSVETLLAIADAEETAGVVLADRYWLHFDVKDGMDHERLARISSPEDRNWIEAKLRLGKIDPSTFNILGFGDKVVAQVLASNAALARWRTVTRSPDWWTHFGDCMSRIMWFCAGRKRQIT